MKNIDANNDDTDESSIKNESNKKDWKWQLKNSIQSIEQFEQNTGIKLEKREKEELEKVFEMFPLSITPYYLSIIDKKDYKNDPVFKQAFGCTDELKTFQHEFSDPLSEDKDSPVEGLTHRYPDRVLFHVSNICSMYCRHCTRKRKVGDSGYIPSKEQFLKGIEYIKKTPQIRDVLLSGGDPFMLSDDMLDWLLTEIRKIDHVEIIRIGTRMPVVLPYRITDNLISILKKHHPIWINTHFNHPNEITSTSSEVLKQLADNGFPLGNQSVLLAGVNDCPQIMKKLLHKLIQNRVRPYYLYQCDLSEGLSHFRTSIGRGIEIMESLIGHTSGFARPTYVIDAPGGGGKIPVMPNYLISWNTNKVVLRNYEGVITTYKEPENYNPDACSSDCNNCSYNSTNKTEYEQNDIGIEKLLSSSNSTISLVPENNDRLQRRYSNV